MTTRKTSSSKSRTTSSNTSTGKKVTSSRGVSNKTKSSSLKSKTQTALKKNQRSLTTTGTQSKKKRSTNTSTAKAKVKSTKTSTKGTTSTSTQKRQVRGKRHTGHEIKYTRSKNLDLFPWVQTFPWRLDDRKEKKVCHFQCYEHATKYIVRYKYEPKHYKLQCHTSVPNHG